MTDNMQNISWDVVKTYQTRIFRLPLPKCVLRDVFQDYIHDINLKINFEKEQIIFIGICTNCHYYGFMGDEKIYEEEELEPAFLFCKMCGGPCFIECHHTSNCNCLEYVTSFGKYINFNEL